MPPARGCRTPGEPIAASIQVTALSGSSGSSAMAQSGGVGAAA